VGAQDELVFDGHSCVIDHTGQTIARARQFGEELLICDVDLDAAAAARLRDAGHRPAARRSERRVAILPPFPPPETPLRPRPIAVHRRAAGAGRGEIYAALMLGLRDYVEKNGFERVVLGLSGGIDSALVACVAADALGGERLSTAIMPSSYSSRRRRTTRARSPGAGSARPRAAIASILDAYLQTLRDELQTLRDELQGGAGEGSGGSSRSRLSAPEVPPRPAARISPRRTCRRASGATC